MQYNVSKPEEYLEKLDEDWRKSCLLELRNLIFQRLPGIVEGINYKMLSFTYKGEIILHLNAQKNYVSLYVGNAEKVDIDGKLLEGLSVGKGCIRFKKGSELHKTNVGIFISRLGEMKKKVKTLGVDE